MDTAAADLDWPPLGHPPRMALSNDALEDALQRLAANIDAAPWRLVELVVEFDRRGLWRDLGCRSCAHRLSARCGIAPGAAREKLRVGRALLALPATSEAFRRGELSYSKARAITRVADPDNEEALLGIAKHGSASHLERLVAAHRRNVRAHEREEERLRGAATSDQRSVSWHVDETGMLCLRARLAPEQGAAVVEAIEAASEALAADRAPDAPAGHADVSAETPAYEGPAEASARRRSRRRADALVELVAGRDAESPLVTVLVDADALVDADDLPDRAATTCQVENGPALTLDAVRRLCCDGPLAAIVERGGEVVGSGRRTRAISGSLSRAMRRRDGGACTFPGCAAHRRLHGHHLVHWAEGGPTELANLTSLCPHCHRLVHEGGYTAVRGADGEVVFRTPAGAAIDPRAPAMASDGPIEADVAASGAEIDADTGWRWDGSRMDY